MDLSIVYKHGFKDNDLRMSSSNEKCINLLLYNLIKITKKYNVLDI